MLRILLALLLMSTPAWATVQWRNGTGANTILGTSNASDIDTNTYNNIVAPLDSLLANYREGINIQYNSASQLTVTSGEITVSDSGGTVRLMLKNANSTTVTWSDIDTGAESTGTYYVYAIAAAASSTSATFKISASSTSPSGSTYYKRLGSFVNDSASNISAIVNDNQFGGIIGSSSSKSVSTTYQALTDGYVFASSSACGNSQTLCAYTDSLSSPAATPIPCLSNTSGITIPYNETFVVRKGDYWKVTSSCAQPGNTNTVNFVSSGI